MILVKMKYLLATVIMLFSVLTYSRPSVNKVIYITSNELRVAFFSHRKMFTVDLGNMVERLWVIQLAIKNASTSKSLPAYVILVDMFLVTPNTIHWENI